MFKKIVAVLRENSGIEGPILANVFGNEALTYKTKQSMNRQNPSEKVVIVWTIKKGGICLDLRCALPSSTETAM